MSFADIRKAAFTGFTVLELLTALALLSVLMVVALPLYFDHAATAEIERTVQGMSEFKTRVKDSYNITGHFPVSNREAGMADPDDYATDTIKRIGVGKDGIITVTFDIRALDDGQKLQFIPSPERGGVVWKCRTSPDRGVAQDYLPAECKG